MIQPIAYTAHDLDIMARTLYGEAEGNNERDAYAIAWVIRNRYEYRRRAWGKTIAEVCKKPWQFSCWHDHDDFHRKNNQRILKVTQDDAWFRTCMYICRKVLEGEVFDPTFRSTHYYATWVPAPAWARGKEPVYAVSHNRGTRHLFYNDIDTPKPIITAVKDVVVQHPVKSTTAATATTATVLESTDTTHVTEAATEVLPPVHEAVGYFNLLQQFIRDNHWEMLCMVLLVVAVVVILWHIRKKRT